ncbi:putative sodium-dependent multivitamin transporter [Uloborus diversus]|uniref:putative sodium-dependent multivitamin transporter n=1 Tax=Uloborus diversus TaxID=327109 RepID=UPI0024096A0B|nr:putative sodium-dependent multivitamin transporter [Uloborus diversus]
MDFEQHSLTVYDYVIFTCMLGFSAGIGIYYRFSGGRQQTNKEYFLADKSMPVMPVAFSLMASFMSAITLLGVASENYMYGTQFVVLNIAYIIGTPICAFVFLPVFFQMQATSAFEYLEKRFCKEVRLLASGIFIFEMVLYMSIVLYAPAMTLSAVTGLSTWSCVLSVGVVCTFYCTIGGMKAVLWTDVFQSLLMFSAVFVVIVKGTLDVGGIHKVWEIAQSGKRIEFLNFDFDPRVRHTVWSLIIGGVFTYSSIYAVNQAQIQRLLTVKSLKKSQLALFISWPILTILSIATSFAGLVVYANLSDCDPLLRAKETSVRFPDQILPYFVMTSLTMLPGLPGLFVAGIFSGSMSTISSCINSLAAVTVEDFLRPRCFGKTSERKIAFFTKLIAFLYGLLCMLLTFIVEKLGGVLQASLTIFNVIGGPLLGLFSLGMLVSRANSKGSTVGFLFALAFCFWIGFGGMHKGKRLPSYHRSTDACPVNNSLLQTSHPQSHYLNESFSELNFTIFNNSQIKSDDALFEEYIFPLYTLSYMWYAAIGWCTCMIFGLGFSLMLGEKERVNPLLLSPLVTSWSREQSPVLEVALGPSNKKVIVL